MSLLYNSDTVNLLLKNVGRDRRLNVVILECFICWWERGKVRKVGGSEVARWERWEGSEVERWER